MENYSIEIFFNADSIDREEIIPDCCVIPPLLSSFERVVMPRTLKSRRETTGPPEFPELIGIIMWM